MKKMNKFWNFKEINKGANGENKETSRTLELIGEIAKDSWFGDEVAPKEFKNELNANKGDINVLINSPGGDIFAASEIYTALKEYSSNSGRVNVVIDALAASAASVIAMAGDEVKMSPTAYMMIHNPWTVTAGNGDEMRVVARQLDEIKEGVINAYQIKSGLPREQISQMMDAEMYVSAAEAVRLGLADEILFENDEKNKKENEEKSEGEIKENEEKNEETERIKFVAFSQKAANQMLARIRGKPDYSKYRKVLEKLKN